MDLSACDRLLVVKPSSLGDIVHTLPAVEAIHRLAPGMKIDWLVNTSWAPLLEEIPFLDEVIAFPRHEFTGISGLLRGRTWAASRLRAKRYDLVADFQGLLRSALLSRLARPRRIIGFESAREGAPYFYHQSVRTGAGPRQHAVRRNLELAGALGADTSRVAFTLSQGAPLEDPEVAALFSGAHPAPVLLHPFSRGKGKSLSPGEVLEFVDRLAPHPVLLVGVAEKELGITWPEHVVDLLGRTSLPQLIHLIRSCSWTVSVDSGPMHLAAALTDRVLSLHTWSDPAVVGPWPDEAMVFREGRLCRVRDLEPGQYPERRDLKSAYGRRERLFAPSDVEQWADFLNEQLSS